VEAVKPPEKLQWFYDVTRKNDCKERKRMHSEEERTVRCLPSNSNQSWQRTSPPKFGTYVAMAGCCFNCFAFERLSIVRHAQVPYAVAAQGGREGSTQWRSSSCDVRGSTQGRSSSCDVRGSNNQKSFDERAAAMKVCCWKWQRLVGDWLRHTKRKMGEWGVKRLEVAAGSLQKHEMKFLQKFWSGDPLELLDIPREFSNQASYVFNGEDAGCDVTIINYSCRTNVLENIHEMKRDTRRENKERWGGRRIKSLLWRDSDKKCAEEGKCRRSHNTVSFEDSINKKDDTSWRQWLRQAARKKNRNKKVIFRETFLNVTWSHNFAQSGILSAMA